MLKSAKSTELVEVIYIFLSVYTSLDQYCSHLHCSDNTVRIITIYVWVYSSRCRYTVWELCGWRINKIDQNLIHMSIHRAKNKQTFINDTA